MLCGVDRDEPGAGGGDEVLLDLLTLTRPQQPVVDEDAGQLVADGALHQCGGHRRVDAAGQPADRATVADLLRGPARRGLGDVRCRSSAGAMPGDVVQEAAQHLLAVRRVHDLGVVLHAGQSRRAILEGGDRRTRRRRGDGEPVGRCGDGVAVAHPDRLLSRAARRAAAPPDDAQLGAAVLTGPVCATVPPSAWAIAWNP